MWPRGLVALWHVKSWDTRNRTSVPCCGRQILNHWATREAPVMAFIMPCNSILTDCFMSSLSAPWGRRSYLFCSPLFPITLMWCQNIVSVVIFAERMSSHYQGLSSLVSFISEVFSKFVFIFLSSVLWFRP